MTITSIFVATNFSDEAELAVAHAERIAQRLRARVVLGHICHGPSDAERADTERDEAHARLRAIAEDMTGRGLAVTTAVESGFADEAICAAADETDADLIVLGTHGRTGVRRLLLGSIAERGPGHARARAVIASRM